MQYHQTHTTEDRLNAQLDRGASIVWRDREWQNILCEMHWRQRWLLVGYRQTAAVTRLVQ